MGLKELHSGTGNFPSATITTAHGQARNVTTTRSLSD